MRRISFVLLTIEAIALVFPTLFAAAFLLFGAGSVWPDAFLRGQALGLLVWTVMVLGLTSAWWLLLTFFYRGQIATRNAPAAIWAIAAITAALSVTGYVGGDAVAGVEVFAPGMLFVPTFIHLSAEVWLAGTRGAARKLSSSA